MYRSPKCRRWTHPKFKKLVAWEYVIESKTEVSQLKFEEVVGLRHTKGKKYDDGPLLCSDFFIRLAFCMTTFTVAKCNRFVWVFSQNPGGFFFYRFIDLFCYKKSDFYLHRPFRKEGKTWTRTNLSIELGENEYHNWFFLRFAQIKTFMFVFRVY